MQARHRARIVAVQALFEIDMVGHEATAVLAQRLQDESLTEDAARFAQELVSGVLKHQPQLDVVIKEIAPDWPVDQLATIDRNVLRIAIYEIAVGKETPVKVAINEAVELAKLFGSESSRRFVNGVLGTLVKDLSKYRIRT